MICLVDRMAQYFTNLKSKNEETRLRAARDLQKYVQIELRELPADRHQVQLDAINSNIYELITGSEVHEKKGGILAIGRVKHVSSSLNTSCVHAYVLNVIMYNTE